MVNFTFLFVFFSVYLDTKGQEIALKYEYFENRFNNKNFQHRMLFLNNELKYFTIYTKKPNFTNSRSTFIMNSFSN